MTIVVGADPFKATTMKVDQNDLQNFQTFSFQKRSNKLEKFQKHYSAKHFKLQVQYFLKI